jgi:signal transduction histidine kinase
MQLQSSDDALLRNVALQRSADDVLRAAVGGSRAVLNADSTFAAVADAGSYPMTIMDGIRDPRFGRINVRAGAGLGGQVLLRGEPLSIADYAHDPTISRDFAHVVSDIEGLSGMACVPIVGPSGVEALLYVASRISRSPGDVAIAVLERTATYAELALHQLASRQQEIELELLRERQRLAVELHDSVAQTLFAIGVAAHYSRRQQDPDALLAALEEIEGTAADARRQLRETLQRLSREGDGIAFEARLEGEIRLFERATGCRLRITRHGERRELPQPVEDLIIDTLIEGLRNMSKHAAARLALAHLGYGVDQVTLTVHAQVAGGAPPPGTDWKGADTGAGLALLEQRAAQLRGLLSLGAAPSGRTTLRLALPTLPAARAL